MKKNLFYVLCSVILICKLYYWFFVFPNVDEAYYWFWGQYPDFSYHDHPALQALIQALFSTIFGTSYFALRLPVIICCILIATVLYLFAKKLDFKNKPVAIALFFSCPLFFLFTTYAWNDYVLLTNCILSGYFYINFLHDIWLDKKGKTADIFLGSLFFGLAILSKYNAVFLGLGIFFLLILNKKFYKVFKDYRFYISLLIVAILSSPIIYWNKKNKFGSFEFNLQQRTLSPIFDEFNLFGGNYLGFILGTILMLSPFFCWAIFKVFIDDKKIKNKSPYQIVYTKFAVAIFSASSVVFLFFSLFSNVLFYWNIVGLIFITFLASNYLIKKKKVLITLSYSALGVFGIIFHFGVVPLTSVFGGSDRDNIYHYGWQKIGNEVKKLQTYKALPIVTSNYRSASLLAFELNNPKIFSYSKRFDQFDYWSKNIKYKSNTEGILLTDSNDDDVLSDEIKALFKKITFVDTLNIEKYGYKIKAYYLYKGVFK